MAEGIKGHRIQKTIRLKIDIQDGTGSAPAYPVLVHLSVGGPRHGSLILDPDGSRLRCDQATFLWHERDESGNIIAPNEEFEYELGTFSGIAGFVADPLNLGKVKPVWGLAEMLNVAYGVIDPSGTVTFTAFGFPVQPEPGKPDHFVGNAISHNPTGDVVELWSDYGTYEVALPPATGASFAEFNAYYLLDQFDNPNFGYVNTSGTSNLPNVTVGLADQTSGDPTIGSDVDFFGYHVSVVWTDNPSMPQGNQAASITVSYPTDPDGDWPAGQVTKNITLQFDRGNFHFVQPWYHYEATLPDGNPGVDDSAFPIVVSPGAEGDSIPRTSAGDPSRLVLLTLSGTRFPLALPYPDTEPFPDGHKYWQRTCPEGATCPPYVYSTYQTHDPHDPRLEVADLPTFQLSLVDTRGNVITDAAFQVDLCPRYDHDSPNPPDQPGRDCTIAPIQSRNGVISDPPVTVNSGSASPDDARGYIGIELVKAPRNPGDYFIDLKSLGQNYRVREESNLLTNGEYQSAFRFVTVVGIQILDENFRQIYDLAVAQPKVIYIRYLAPSEQSNSVAADVSTADAANNQVSTLPAVALNRVGTTPAFLSGPITVDPPAGALGPLRERPSSTTAIANLELTAADGIGTLTAKPANQPLSAAVTTLTNLQFDFKIGELPAWGNEPNLLFGNGSDYVDMSVRITDAAGIPLNGDFTVSLAPQNAGQGTVSNATPHPSDGRISFRYTSPSLMAGPPAFVRPTFAFTIQYPDGTPLVVPAQTARPVSQCRRIADAEPGSHCLGDPNFPVVYRQYDFRRSVFYGQTATYDVTDDEYVDSNTMDENTIQAFLAGRGSLLARLYFVGSQPDYDNPSSPVYSTSSTAGWPGVFVDFDGSGVFENSRDFFMVTPSNPQPPPDGTAGVRFAHVLWFFCQLRGINPEVMVTHLQAENTVVSGSTAADPGHVEPALLHLFNVKSPTGHNYAWPTVQISEGAFRARDWFDRATDVPVPPSSHSGHLFGVVTYKLLDYKDQDFLFALSWSGPQVPAALFVQTRASFALFKYTTQVNTNADGGGNYLFMNVFAGYESQGWR